MAVAGPRKRKGEGPGIREHMGQAMGEDGPIGDAIAGPEFTPPKVQVGSPAAGNSDRGGRRRMLSRTTARR